MQQRILLQILLLAQHVSDTTMPIIRNFKSIIQWLLPVVLRAVKMQKKNNFVSFCGILFFFTFLQHAIPQAATTV